MPPGTYAHEYKVRLMFKTKEQQSDNTKDLIQNILLENFV